MNVSIPATTHPLIFAYPVNRDYHHVCPGCGTEIVIPPQNPNCTKRMVAKLSRLKESEGLGTKEYIFPCSADDGEFLRISWDEDPEFRALWVQHWGKPRSWSRRAKDIYDIIVGREHNWGEIFLSEETVNRIRKTLDA